VIAIVPYEPWHGAAIAVQAAQAPELRSAGPRAVRRVIEQADFPRIDMMVRSGFERAADFASLLGFTREAVLAKVGADGSDYEVWVRFAPKGGQ
jgi:hypothetical protein